MDSLGYAPEIIMVSGDTGEEMLESVRRLLLLVREGVANEKENGTEIAIRLKDVMPLAVADGRLRLLDGLIEALGRPGD